MKDAENSGQCSYEPIPKDDDDDNDENIDDANETLIKPTTESCIPKPMSDQSPMSSTVSLKPTHVSSLVRESSMSDLEKELHEFDIDLDQDDVSEALSPSSSSSKEE